MPPYLSPELADVGHEEGDVDAAFGDRLLIGVMIHVMQRDTLDVAAAVGIACGRGVIENHRSGAGEIIS